jgi:hypothetical protein
MEARMTYKEHLISVETQRDVGGCFWLPMASVSWSAGERKHVVFLKGRPQDRFVYSNDAENSAISIACKWVDNHSQNGSRD